MAERTVSVRLKAVIDQYKQAMGEAGRATTDVTKRADDFKKLGDSTASLGDSMTRNITLPLVAAGGAAVAMAGQFDNVFTTMRTTAGVADDEVQGLKESVLALATETGRSPQELADALLLIRSSGFQGAEALDVLETSAKGAAAGMGETREIANALTNVIAGYGQGNISAAEAMDVLTASVQEGKAEASEMAPQFGRLVPIAAELGVSFADVGGSLAYLTRASGDASQSSTALQGILSKLLRPSQQGAEALDAIGLSATRVRTMLGEQGLHATLVALRAQLGDSGFGMLFDDVQALNGALQLTGPGMEDARAVIDNVTDSAGAADEAFGKWAESMGAKNAKAWSEMQVSMIKFGDAIAPIAATVLGFLSDLLSKFADLPGPLQNVVLGFLGLMAAIGPVLSVSGRLMSTFSTFSKLLANWAVPTSAIQGLGSASATSAGQVGRLNTSLLKAGLVTGAFVVAVEAFDRLRPRVDASVSEMESSLLDFARSGQLGGEAARVLGGDLDGLADAFERVNDPSVQTQVVDALAGGFARDSHLIEDAKDRLNALDDALTQLAGRDPDAARATFDAISEAMEGQGVSAEELEGELDGYRDAMASADTQNELTTGSTEELGGAMEGQADATAAAEAALQQYQDSVTAMFDPLFAAEQALRSQQTAIADLAVKEAELATATNQYGAESAEAMAAQDALTEAQSTARQAVVDLHGAATALIFAIREESLSVDEARQRFIDMAVQQGVTAEQAAVLADQFGLTAAAAENMAGDYMVTVLSSGIENTTANLAFLKQQVDAIDGRTAHVSVNFRTGGLSLAGMIPGIGRMHEGGVVPGPRGAEVAAILQAGERVLPLDHPLTAIGSGARMTAVGRSGGTVNHFHYHLERSLIADERQFEQMLMRTHNKLLRTNRGFNAA